MTDKTDDVVADKAKAPKAKKNRSVENLRNGAVSFDAVSIAAGATFVLSDKDVQNKRLMARIVHAEEIGLVKIS